ncbi:MAG: T9SS type A sorting domain-containing protein [Bacteroidales bacterium]|nr:T9SS type A sorting domain-containing protein [Bacteroidales bacterium]
MIDAPSIKVWSYNHTIYIENAPDTKYTIIDLNGRVITTSKTQSTKEDIRINKSGVLIVIIGNQSFKITLY